MPRTPVVAARVVAVLAPFAAALVAPSCGRERAPLSSGSGSSSAPPASARDAVPPVSSDAPSAARAASPAPPASSAAPASPLSSFASSSPSLVADDPWIELPIAGGEPVVVGLPLGAKGKMPMLIVAHGFGDNPSWQCAWWRVRVGNAAFVVCPRGLPHARLPSGNLGYKFASPRALEKEIEAAIAAVVARYPAFADPARAVFAGFSQGAIFGADIVARNPGRFPRAIFTEGGSSWTAQRAKLFREGGGERILLACGSAGCAAASRRAAATLQHAGARARAVHAAGAGHVYWGTALEPMLYAELAWVVEEDPRFLLEPR